MAQILDNYDFDKPSSTSNTNRENRYPWGTWFDGGIWKINRDDDFPGVPALMMERIIRTRASAKKVRVRLRHEDENTIVFQASIGGGHVAPRRRARPSQRELV